MPKYNLNKILGQPAQRWEKFHQKTKFKKWIPEPDIKDWPTSWTTVYFKEYPRLDKIILPKVKNLDKVDLGKALLNRKSQRLFSTKPLSLEQLSQLLYFSAGLRDNKPPWIGNRTYPSPGGRYPLEVYLISLNTDLPKGIYHYNLRSHSLEFLLKTENFKTLFYFSQKWLKKASLIVLFTAIFNRNTMKYGVRGYRHIMQEAGHLGQNFYLVSTAMGIGVCGVGGYLDDELNKLLDIDGIQESVIYALGVGDIKK